MLLQQFYPASWLTPRQITTNLPPCLGVALHLNFNWSSDRARAHAPARGGGGGPTVRTYQGDHHLSSRYMPHIRPTLLPAGLLLASDPHRPCLATTSSPSAAFVAWGHFRVCTRPWLSPTSNRVGPFSGLHPGYAPLTIVGAFSGLH